MKTESISNIEGLGIDLPNYQEILNAIKKAKSPTDLYNLYIDMDRIFSEKPSGNHRETIGKPSGNHRETSREPVANQSRYLGLFEKIARRYQKLTKNKYASELIVLNLRQKIQSTKDTNYQKEIISYLKKRLNSLPSVKRAIRAQKGKSDINDYTEKYGSQLDALKDKELIRRTCGGARSIWDKNFKVTRKLEQEIGIGRTALRNYISLYKEKSRKKRKLYMNSIITVLIIALCVTSYFKYKDVKIWNTNSFTDAKIQTASIQTGTSTEPYTLFYPVLTKNNIVLSKAEKDKKLKIYLQLIKSKGRFLYESEILEIIKK